MTRGVLQPSGQVTLVFSDIEGSTRLLEELGTDAYREALAEHRRIVREAYARYSGYEVDYEGDAFFYAFSSAPDAVAAVSAAMAGLEDGLIKIRVGIHTGEPGLDPPKYVGMDVHFAARVMSSAHGGQVVLSAATAEQVELGLADLGEHRLKDIEDAVSLYQLGEGASLRSRRLRTRTCQRRHRASWGEKRSCTRRISSCRRPAYSRLRAQAARARRASHSSSPLARATSASRTTRRVSSRAFSRRFATPRSSYPRSARPCLCASSPVRAPSLRSHPTCMARSFCSCSTTWSTCSSLPPPSRSSCRRAASSRCS